MIKAEEAGTHEGKKVFHGATSGAGAPQGTVMGPLCLPGYPMKDHDTNSV